MPIAHDRLLQATLDLFDRVGRTSREPGETGPGTPST